MTRSVTGARGDHPVSYVTGAPLSAAADGPRGAVAQQQTSSSAARQYLAAGNAAAAPASNPASAVAADIPAAAPFWLQAPAA